MKHDLEKKESGSLGSKTTWSSVGELELGQTNIQRKAGSKRISQFADILSSLYLSIYLSAIIVFTGINRV